MIKARHKWFIVRFFRWYTDRGIRKNFSSVVIHGDLPDTSDRPLLLIANHFSWWDGFFILWLNTRYFKKRFHVMMLEEQLRKNPVLNKTGAFSIQRGDRSMLDSLEYAREVLAGSGKGESRTGSPLLLIYPQGKIQSMHEPAFRFEKGLERITRGLEGTFTLLMVMVLVDYFSSRKPELHYYFEVYPSDRPLNVSDLEATYNRFATRSVQLQTQLTD